MQHAAFVLAARLLGAALLSCLFMPAQAGEFASASECRMQWDDEFASYARQYRKCGPECWNGVSRHHEYLRYSDWLHRLEEWQEFCRAMSGTELRLHGAQSPAVWPVPLQTAGQSSCELIRAGEVKYKFQWKAKDGRRCYSNAGLRRQAAACCPSD